MAEDISEDVPKPKRIGLLRLIALVLGPLCLIPALALPAPFELSPEAWKLVCVAAWMVIWWLSEALPLSATALLPVVVMPSLGILPSAEVTAQYGSPLIFLFLGGFLLAAAMQRHGLHRRIALFIVANIGRSASGIIAGFMLATAFLSMWISNTATAVMMVAVGASVVDFVANRLGAAQARNFGVALMLAIAYAASIGGVGTLIGTPPNALLASLLAQTHEIEIGFFQWMKLGLPVVAVMLPLTHLLLTRVIFPVKGLDLAAVRPLIRAELEALGPMSRGEGIVAAVFALAAFAWIFRAALNLPISDSGIAILAAVILFAIPLGRDEGFVLDWSVAPSLPWGVLLLFGGGLALAAAFEATGLAGWIGARVAGLEAVPLWALILVVALVIVFLTEITSNTASTATFLPVLAAVAAGLGVAVEWLTVPVALGASMAFMMPVATPPNAIVFSHTGLRLADMARAGVVLNVISIVTVWAATLWLAPIVFGL
ncbi:sodium-dependent dicarboxylate transporter 2/3/5 [Rhodobacter aestuarii]|uniref:Solute carrier family 13 (Sodium-dependent dicarboxylate transporter), member 2/3/5 n=1 Tax=Rhodobacter aestuarii TaxID=453582 RepID=A0A1N7KRP2_9RHOB|nr:DASS family sodium-coupled anion symporter [Rhodobacter aestuarii]PTV95610.1 sodium-dependent dicarboxylate transporter 2/3/5 [Rhodobacter aestuarii]SIS64166.1 solute carrier family 13 (sodium-dependent dicarboxylate transporter), member 2/3/5 [Rhodobacter aestuarii]